MKYNICFLLFLFNSFWSISQENTSKEIDSIYKEDQFYIGVTYNLIGNKPTDFSQSGFSSGIHLGIIKDMPINDARNKAIGIGIGYSVNSFNENLLIIKNNAGITEFSIIQDSGTYTKNKFLHHLIELPIQYRWRTSSPNEYKFWRIYTGFKIGYLFAHSTKYNGDLGNFKYNNIGEFNTIQYGLTTSIGYNTWNLYIYYGLRPIFSLDAKINGTSIDSNSIKIGLMFYIL